jgi:hypothetical protein
MQERRSLQKSCTACIKAKRRCSQQLPQCGRCIKQSLQCSYYNEPLPTSDATQQNSAHYGVLVRKSNGTLAIEWKPNPKPIPAKDCYEFICSWYIPPFNTATGLVSAGHHGLHVSSVDIVLGNATLNSLRDYLRAQPITFLDTRKTGFIHSQAYSCGLPKLLQEAYGDCVFYKQTGITEQMIKLLQARIFSLRYRREEFISFFDILDALQSLILIFSICLAENNRDLWKLAYLQLDLLVELTKKLWLDAPSKIPNNVDQWTAWTIAESVRRTILMSHMIHGICRELNLGYCSLTMELSSLPFDTITTLWNANSENEWRAMTSRPFELMSYREFSIGYKTGEIIVRTPFEDFLITACQGQPVLLRG